jgi:beta-glucanase (GH16 family)
MKHLFFQNLKNRLAIAAFLYAYASHSAAPAHAATSVATRLEFASTAQTIPLGACGLVKISAASGAMQLAAVAAPTTVTVSGGNGNLEFFSNAACTVRNPEVVIPASQNSGNLFVSGSKEGSYVLSVNARGYNAATQTVVISSPPPPACSGSQAAPTAPPAQAAAAGFKNLVFDDEFNSTSTISPNNSGTFNWYTYNPYTASAELNNNDMEVNNGCLTILTDLSGYSDGLTTIHSTSPTSGTFQHGYFEVRMQFYPAGSEGGAWPAFWSYALEGVQGASPFAELDFVEAYPGGKGGATSGNNGVTLLTTVHQWTSKNGSSSSVQQPNDVPALPENFNFDAFHVYGCLWTKDSVTWYIDNQPVMTVATGPGTKFTALEQDHMFLVLGTGKNWPATYDYVHVWL